MNEGRKTDELAEKAKQVSVPEWAIHIAVRTNVTEQSRALGMLIFSTISSVENT